MAELMYEIARQLNASHPEFSMQVHASGSATAPPALTEGTANVGAMSRAMSSAELEQFRQRHGYDLTRIIVAFDAIVIIVNPRNRLTSISLEEIDRVFSASSACPQNLNQHGFSRWDELIQQSETHQPGALAGRSMQRFSRNSASGTYSWFREHALCGGAMAVAVNHMPSHNAIVNAVSHSVNGIGYVGFAHSGYGIKTLPIRMTSDSDQLLLANRDNIVDGSYPLSRQLYLYLNLPPDRDLSPAMRSLLSMLFSTTGEAIIARARLMPLSTSQQQQQLQGIMAASVTTATTRPP